MRKLKEQTKLREEKNKTTNHHHHHQHQQQQKRLKVFHNDVISLSCRFLLSEMFLTHASLDYFIVIDILIVFFFVFFFFLKIFTSWINLYLHKSSFSLKNLQTLHIRRNTSHLAMNFPTPFLTWRFSVSEVQFLGVTIDLFAAPEDTEEGRGASAPAQHRDLEGQVRTPDSTDAEQPISPWWRHGNTRNMEGNTRCLTSSWREWPRHDVLQYLGWWDMKWKMSRY